MFWENFMESLSYLITYRGLWLALYAVSLTCLYQIFVRFVPIKQTWYWKACLIVSLYLSISVIIWVGDENLLYAFPAFMLSTMLCTTGDRLGRLTVNIIFFCIIMSINAMIDTFLGNRIHNVWLAYYDVFTRLLRPAVWGALWLLLRKRLPQTPPRLPHRIWRVVFGLALMPLCSLLSVILVARTHYYTNLEVQHFALNLSLTVLPFVFITSLVLLLAIMILSDHEALEQANQMANMRQLYYDGLQREQRQVRTLRHDLRNHLTVVMGLLEQQEHHKAMEYLQNLSESPALHNSQLICENEAANVVLNAKLADIENLELECDYSISLPKTLAILDIDLCALLGNALDNAIEAAQKTNDRRIILRCRTEKGMFMLRVANTMPNDVSEDLSTTKPDKELHGFGIAGMREIALRYSGTLETQTQFGRFELIVALPLK